MNIGFPVARDPKIGRRPEDRAGEALICLAPSPYGAVYHVWIPHKSPNPCCLILQPVGLFQKIIIATQIHRLIFTIQIEAGKTRLHISTLNVVVPT